MGNTTLITALMTFRLRPGVETTRREAWNQMARQPLATPACQRFRLLRNRNDPDEYAVMTEWGSCSDLNSFVRDTALLWVDRGLDCTLEPPRYSVWEQIPLDGVEKPNQVTTKPDQITSR